MILAVPLETRSILNVNECIQICHQQAPFIARKTSFDGKFSFDMNFNAKTIIDVYVCFVRLGTRGVQQSKGVAFHRKPSEQFSHIIYLLYVDDAKFPFNCSTRFDTKPHIYI